MDLLINEPPLLVLPTLAKLIGLNESIVFQQVHYWLRKTSHEYDGAKWFYKTYEEWHEEFPFWSVATVRRTITSLEKQGLLISTTKYNKLGIDKTKWYTINYGNYKKLMSSRVAQNEQSSCSNCADGALKMSNPHDQVDHTNNQRILTENTTDIYNLVVDKEAQPEKSEKANAQTAFEFYEQNGFGTLSPYVAEKIGTWIEELSEELVLEAMKIATENNARNWKYVESILKNWANKNFKSLADVEADRKRFEIQKQQRNRGKGMLEEKIPEWFYKRQSTDQEQPKSKNIDFEAERQKILEKLKSQ